MIFKTASPTSPDVSITIDNVPTNYLSLQRISIEEKENNHNLVILDFSGLDPNSLFDFVDKPIYINISFPSLGGVTFHGYIGFLEPHSETNNGLVNQSAFQITRMYCFGASYMMKSKKSKAWENVTISDIAKTIADTYKFSVSVPKDPYRFPRLVQSSKSDWEFLKETCNTLGYSISARGTHLHIWDPFQAMNHRISYAVLKTIAGLNGNVSPNVGQVLNFDATIGNVSTGGERTPETIHILDKNNVVLSVGGDLNKETSGLGTPLESPFTDTLSKNADSYEMANKFVMGSLRNKFSMSAIVQITGNPTIKPGGIVKLDKYNTDFDGFWYVRSARHDITHSQLVTTLEMVKDSIGDATYTTEGTEDYVSPPTPSLINKRWISSTNYVNTY
jgi:hypothetical protein